MLDPKPKTARSRRAFAARDPLPTENPKTTLFLRGTSTSSLLNSILTDLHSLKRPYAIRFQKKNPIHPFFDASSLEFFSQKNDASLLLFASHSKKRPHALTFVRCFGGSVLDMLEVLVVPETARTLQQFKGEKCKIGVKPLLSFSGSLFDNPVKNEYTLAKNMFLDFFSGAETRTVDVEGLGLLISFSVGEEGGEGEGKPQIQMRCWRIITKRSGEKVPRVEVEEMGPRIDLRVGRIKQAEEGVWKEAMKKAKGTEAKIKKNVDTDIVGDKFGRIHLGRQDLTELQTRKMKGLKRRRGVEDDNEGDAEGEDIVSEDEDLVADGGVELKKARLQ